MSRYDRFHSHSSCKFVDPGTVKWDRNRLDGPQDRNSSKYIYPNWTPCWSKIKLCNHNWLLHLQGLLQSSVIMLSYHLVSFVNIYKVLFANFHRHIGLGLANPCYISRIPMWMIVSHSRIVSTLALVKNNSLQKKETKECVCFCHPFVLTMQNGLSGRLTSR